MDYRKHISKSRLSMEEKADLRSEFLSRTGLKSKPSNYFINRAPHYVGIAALSLLLVAVGASPFAIAAENAQPGDLLYPVKTAVNEPVKKAVRIVTGKKVAEPATVLVEEDAQDSDVEKADADDKEKPKAKRTGVQKTSSITAPGSVPIVPAAASSTKKAVKDLLKTTESVTDELPVDINIPLPGTKKEPDDADEHESGQDDSDESAAKDISEAVRNTADKTAGTVTDTVGKATGSLDLSI